MFDDDNDGGLRYWAEMGEQERAEYEAWLDSLPPADPDVYFEGFAQ